MPGPEDLGSAAVGPVGRAGLFEPLLTFFVATALASALFWWARATPAVNDFLHAGIAVVFLYGPTVAARLSRRPFDHQEAGLHLRPIGLNLRILALALAVTWPAFFVSFVLFYSLLCPAVSVPLVQTFLEHFAPLCGGWQGLSGAELRFPARFLLLAASQVIVVAVPEEVFFRGYLLGRLEERWPSRRVLWGAPVGLALLVSSALFALGHYLVDFQPARLAVFVPGLVFGWMRARTGSLAPGIAYHALCNLLSDVVFASFFVFPK